MDMHEVDKEEGYQGIRKHDCRNKIIGRGVEYVNKFKVHCRLSRAGYRKSSC